MKKKKRIDELLVERELAEDIEKAKRAVMAGLVYSGEERIDKPGSLLPVETPLRIKDKRLKYVGRGGYNLKKLFNHFLWMFQIKYLWILAPQQAVLRIVH